MTEQNETATAPAEKKQGQRKVQRGVVKSTKMDKTISVGVERTFPHPVYEKFVRRSAKLYAHDENNEANVGDTVEVIETRPLSKLKRWRLVKVLRRAEG